MYCKCTCHDKRTESGTECDKCTCVPCPACGTVQQPWRIYQHRERCEPYRIQDAATPPIQLLVEWLSDGYVWNWTRMHSDRDAAQIVLGRMAELGIIKHAPHPWGGNIWIIGDKLFGRTDGIELKNGKIVKSAA
jgi:hypothetical protein